MLTSFLHRLSPDRRSPASSPSLLGKIEPLGFHTTRAYGLTEATGLALVYKWQTEWDHLPADDQPVLKARQGVGILTLADIDIKKVVSMESIPHDGKTTGEIMLRGSSIIIEYLKDQKATSKAFKNGWFRPRDVGVIYPDGYFEIKDRSEDTAGENISYVEVESILFKKTISCRGSTSSNAPPSMGRISLLLRYN